MGFRAVTRPVAVVSARMSSRRFPGKVMAKLQDRPVLAWVVESLKACSNLADVVVATSTRASDDIIDDWCKREGVAIFRGPLEDPLGRAIEAARSLRADHLVRISGDSPLIYPPLVYEMVRIFQQEEFQLVTNVFPRTFPRGLSVEIADVGLFEQIAQATDEPAHREHMTLYLYENSAQYRVRNVSASEVFGSIDAGVNLNHLNLCVDNPQDLETLADFLSRQPEGNHRLLDWEGFAIALNLLSKGKVY